MRKITVVGLAAFFTLLTFSGLWAQTSPGDQQKAMEAYMKAAAVTENHKLLAYFVGRWDVTTTMWAFPGSQPAVTKNAGEVSSLLGGRFIMTRFSGTMMGQPFEGVQVDGYDNMQKRFQTFWIDNSSTSFYLLSGTHDAATKTWNDTGKWADPLGGLTPVRTVTRIVGPDEYIYQMYMGLPGGKEFMSMENRCIRKK